MRLFSHRIRKHRRTQLMNFMFRAEVHHAMQRMSIVRGLPMTYLLEDLLLKELTAIDPLINKPYLKYNEQDDTYQVQDL